MSKKERLQLLITVHERMVKEWQCLENVNEFRNLQEIDNAEYLASMARVIKNEEMVQSIFFS